MVKTLAVVLTITKKIKTTKQLKVILNSTSSSIFQYFFLTNTNLTFVMIYSTVGGVGGVMAAGGLQEVGEKRKGDKIPKGKGGPGQMGNFFATMHSISQ